MLLVARQSTSGNQTTASNGESPDQVSVWAGSRELSSPGSWIDRLARRCIASSLPTSEARAFSATPK